ncbi:hypothetical protein GE061_003489 [Apolygus lucorum]|uniref:Uncharacterized protein n=1 Tax=Apolygus lucorum TaxID=248454 RepID=A0A6A4JCN0_APOLU|nr:hypothetical protein GE061_003489 [Apolygus lucorum]
MTFPVDRRGFLGSSGLTERGFLGSSWAPLPDWPRFPGIFRADAVSLGSSGQTRFCLPSSLLPRDRRPRRS